MVERSSPALAPAARDPRWWLHAARLHVWLVGGCLAGWAAVVAARLVVGGDGLVGGTLGTAVWMLGPVSLLALRDPLLRRAEARDGARGPLPRREPVDVRDAAGTGQGRPRWSWRSPLGRTTAIVGAAALFWAACLLGAVAFLVTERGTGGVVAGLVIVLPCALLLLAVAGLALQEVPAGARHVVRWAAGEGSSPVLVQVLGVEPEGGRWFLRPVGGGSDVVVQPFRGRSRIVGGDVLRLWAAPRRDGSFADRVALTGPFGTLFPALETVERAE